MEEESMHLLGKETATPDGATAVTAHDFSVSRARSAFNSRDIEASRAEHSKRRGHNESHTQAGEYLSAFVFGGMDGILTTFCLIASAVGTSANHALAPVVLLVLAIANLVADGFSMGCGELVSQLAAVDHARLERAREEWEVENNLEGEIEEMVEIYTGKGLPEEDARLVMTTLARYPQVFVDVMMVEELKITTDTSEGWTEPIKHGTAMFCAFVLFGMIPVLAYVPLAIHDATVSQRGVHSSVAGVPFYASVSLTVVALLVLGALKGVVTSRPPVRSALTLSSVGIVAASISFILGVVLSKAVAGDV
eukprot:TRINITY_DN67394_c0_g1_i1.p1 TRINITY_DN67394_c0_g1~~TRINITY_DN67394_c0_g1_i1.p1  ORF type:complete len:308 (+),score=51.52 TRINITY_DN67394_c0_g1_i1:186-1109(+)